MRVIRQAARILPLALVRPAVFRPIFGEVPRNKNTERLLKAVASELDYEKQHYMEFAEAEKFLTTTGFSRIDTPDTVGIRLEKKIEGQTVIILYDAKEAIPVEVEKDEKKPKDESQPETETISVVDLSIVVKNEDGSGIMMECETKNAKLDIFKVIFCKSVDDALNTTDIHKMEKVGREYKGPDFANLDEKVQQGFLEMLESFGINDKVLTYIECSSVNKEQLLYIAWLARIKAFASKRT